MLPAFLRSLMLLVALLGLLPGVNEALEHVAELVQHGHVAHSSGDEHHALEGEHGCTPVQHHCGCHATQSATLADLGAWAAYPQGTTVWLVPTPPPAGDSTPSSPLLRDDRAPRTRALTPPTPPPNV